MVAILTLLRWRQLFANLNMLYIHTLLSCRGECSQGVSLSVSKKPVTEPKSAVKRAAAREKKAVDKDAAPKKTVSPAQQPAEDGIDARYRSGFASAAAL
jgi:ATP-dependent DNA helicase RecG